MMTKYGQRCQIIFPCIGSGQQYAHRQETIDTTVPSPHGVTKQLLTTRLMLEIGKFQREFKVLSYIAYHHANKAIVEIEKQVPPRSVCDYQRWPRWTMGCMSMSDVLPLTESPVVMSTTESLRLCVGLAAFFVKKINNIKTTINQVWQTNNVIWTLYSLK